MEIELKIGEMVFGDSRYHGLTVHKVERMTKTQCILDDGTRIRMPFRGHDTCIGGGGFGSTYYRNSTPELIAQYNRQNVLRKIAKIDFTKLETDILKQILTIIQP